MMTEQLIAEVAQDADIDDIAQIQDRAKSAIMNICSPTALAFIEQWCIVHHFKIKGRMSEHVISLSRVAKPGTEVGVSTTSGAPIDASSAPGTSSIHSKTSQAEVVIPSASRRAEHIFNVAMGLEEPDDDVMPQKTQMSRCDICVELSGHGKSLNAKCVHQCLLLCPDCIVACCTDNILDERIKNYIVLQYFPIKPQPILNLTGKWTFDYLHRMKCDLATLEGFIAFRTFIVCNIARICPPIARSTESSAASSTSSTFRLGRRRESTKESGVIHDVSYFVVRNRLKDGIILTPVHTFMDALNTPAQPIAPSDTIAQLGAECVRIFAQEPHLVYRSASFNPPRSCAASLAPAQAPPSDDVAFNYWRGWHIEPVGAPVNMATIAPILAFIGDIWCGGATASGSDKSQFILSWFAHIIQSPGQDPERQLVFRGFPTELVTPLLQFLGRNVIGAQYFAETVSATQSDLATIREDCLLALVNNCSMRNLKSVARECHALWRKAEKHNLTSVEKLAKQRHMPLECEKQVIETKKMAPAVETFAGMRAPHEIHHLMRVAICLAPTQVAPIPIPSARRRFSVIDFAKIADSLVDSRFHATQEAIACSETAAIMFQYLANLRPLVLHWDN